MTVKVKYLSIYTYGPPIYTHNFLKSIYTGKVPSYIKKHSKLVGNICFYHVVDLSHNVKSTYYDMQGDPMTYSEFKTLKLLLQHKD